MLMHILHYIWKETTDKNNNDQEMCLLVRKIVEVDGLCMYLF